MSIRAVFLDREGVLTPKLPKGAYLLRIEDAILVNGVAEALRSLVDQDIPLFIVTNQSCVSRGMISLEDCEAIHEKIVLDLHRAGIPIVASRLCPHADRDACACRKPHPGMILDLCESYGIDPGQSAMIGDSVTDIQAGEAAGCAQNILIDSRSDLSHQVVHSLAEAVHFLNEHTS